MKLYDKSSGVDTVHIRLYVLENNLSIILKDEYKCIMKDDILIIYTTDRKCSIQITHYKDDKFKIFTLDEYEQTRDEYKYMSKYTSIYKFITKNKKFLDKVPGKFM